MKRSPIIHPFIISIYPVISLFAINIGTIAPHNILRALIVAEAVAVFLFVSLQLAAKNRQLAGLLVSLMFIFTFSADPFHEQVDALFNGAFVRRLYFLPIWFIIFAFFAAVLWRNRSNLNKFTAFFNFTSVALVVFPLYASVSYGIRVEKSSIGRESSENIEYLSLMGESPIPEPPTGATPDIYYIVLDAYARQDTLEEFYDFDNSEFIQFLKDTGFYIAGEAQSNYLSTKLAVPAVTNFQYLDTLANYVGRNSDDVLPLSIIGQFPRISSTLRAAGYSIISISPWLDYLSIADADYNFQGETPSFYLRNGFESILINQTPFPEAFNRLFPGLHEYIEPQNNENFIWDINATGGDLERQKMFYVFDILTNSQEFPSPKFVFAHILSPHQPFVFGPNGEERYLNLRLFTVQTPENYAIVKEAYRDEITHLNKLVTQTINSILANSKTPPIIIIQGDHSLRMYLQREPEKTCLKESLTILNAYLMPDGNNNDLYPSISPVNTFRFVLDKYFGTDLGLLPDKTYFSHRFGIYNFVDVTNEVATCTLPSTQ